VPHGLRKNIYPVSWLSKLPPEKRVGQRFKTVVLQSKIHNIHKIN